MKPDTTLPPEGTDLAQLMQAFLDALAREVFDIVLLDIHMPLMDGMKTLALLRAGDTPYRDIPVIALTADAMSGDRERFLALGANGYVTKPVDQGDLIGAVSHLRAPGMAGDRPRAAKRPRWQPDARRGGRHGRRYARLSGTGPAVPLWPGRADRV